MPGLSPGTGSRQAASAIETLVARILVVGTSWRSSVLVGVA
jgi:hypothetical protein